MNAGSRQGSSELAIRTLSSVSELVRKASGTTKGGSLESVDTSPTCSKRSRQNGAVKNGFHIAQATSSNGSYFVTFARISEMGQIF